MGDVEIKSFPAFTCPACRTERNSSFQFHGQCSLSSVSHLHLTCRACNYGWLSRTHFQQVQIDLDAVTGANREY